MKYSEIASYAGINAVDAGKVADLAESIKANGWQGAPILVCNMGLVTGSHRLAALAELFGEPVEDGTSVVATFSLSAAAKAKLEREASRTGKAQSAILEELIGKL